MKATSKQSAIHLTRTNTFSFRVFFKSFLIMLTKAFFGNSDKAKRLIYAVENNVSALKMMIVVNLSLLIPIILLVILLF